MTKSKAYVYLECVIWKNGKGQYHREDGPTIKYSNGDNRWYLNDVKYSEKEYNAKPNLLR